MKASATWCKYREVSCIIQFRPRTCRAYITRKIIEMTFANLTQYAPRGSRISRPIFPGEDADAKETSEFMNVLFSHIAHSKTRRETIHHRTIVSREFLRYFREIEMFLAVTYILSLIFCCKKKKIMQKKVIKIYFIPELKNVILHHFWHF